MFRALRTVLKLMFAFVACVVAGATSTALANPDEPLSGNASFREYVVVATAQ
jgi:hypothetical protein